MTNQKAIDLALEILNSVPALALGEHQELQELANELPRLARWAHARIEQGREPILNAAQ